ncbi:MAG: hypothetical protein HY268_20610, partial [Deltaproteobacteria bacterium]|nr:hypothetical protein [Deltaproteobacteria bacterium]
MVGFFVLLACSPARASAEGPDLFSSPQSLLKQISAKISWAENVFNSPADSGSDAEQEAHPNDDVPPQQSSSSTFFDRSFFSHTVASIAKPFTDFFRALKERFQARTVTQDGDNDTASQLSPTDPTLPRSPAPSPVPAGTPSKLSRTSLGTNEVDQDFFSRLQKIETRVNTLSSLSAPSLRVSPSLSTLPDARVEKLTADLAHLTSRVDTLAARPSSPQVVVSGGGGSSAPSGPSTSDLLRMFALSQRVDNLSNVTITNSSIEGYLESSAAATTYLPLAGGTLTGDLFASSTIRSSGALTLLSGLNFFTKGATTTIPANAVNAFGIATSTSAAPFLTFDTQNFRIGIGTTTPGAALSVKGDLLVTGGLVTGGQTIGGNFSVTGNTTLGDASTDSLTFNAATLGYSSASTSTIPNLTNAFSIATSTANTPIFTISTKFSRIGLIGFGTTSPSQLLSVAGSGYLTGGLGIGNSTTTNGVLESSGLAYIGGVLKVAGSATSTIANGLSVAGSGRASSKGLVVSGGNTLITNGNVGIGTTNPGYKLEVAGTLYNSGVATLVGGNVILDAANGPFTGSALIRSAASGGLYLIPTGVGGSTANYTGIKSDGTFITSGNVGVGTTTPGRKFSVQGDGLFSGNIYAANITATGTIAFTGTGTTSIAGYLDVAKGLEVGSNAGFRVHDLAPANSFRIDSSGNVGIGTTSPSAKLHIDGTGSTDTVIRNRGSIWTAQEQTNGSTNWGFNYNITGTKYIFDGLATYFQQRTGNFSFFTAPTGSAGAAATFTERMRISAAGGLSLGSTYVGTDAGAGNMIISGKVGIGTTTPGARLAVNGPAFFDSKLIRFASSSASQLTLAYQANATSTIRNSQKYAFTIATSTTASPIFNIGTLTGRASTTLLGDFAVNSSDFVVTGGNVGIGTAGPATVAGYTAKLHVVGSSFPAAIVETSASGSTDLAALQLKTGASSNYWQWFARNGDLFAGIA